MARIELKIKHPERVFNKQIYDNLLDYSNFAEVYYGGGSSGKSHGVVQKVVLKACGNWKIPRRVLWLRKVGADVKHSIFADVTSCLSDFGLLEYCEINKTDRTIKLPNGAEFLFKGVDDPEKIKSIKGISDIVMEEATQFTLEDYTQLTLRLREKKHKHKQIFLMFNPVSKTNWVYKYFFLEERPRTKIFHSTYKDNRFLDKETIKTLEELERNNPTYYRIYALGEFATLDKLIFPNYKKERLNPKDLTDLPSFFGLDFGLTKIAPLCSNVYRKFGELANARCVA